MFLFDSGPLVNLYFSTVGLTGIYPNKWSLEFLWISLCFNQPESISGCLVMRTSARDNSFSLPLRKGKQHQQLFRETYLLALLWGTDSPMFVCLVQKAQPWNLQYVFHRVVNILALAMFAQSVSQTMSGIGIWKQLRSTHRWTTCKQILC